MIEVIDTIRVSATLAERYPDGLAQGLWLILAPEQTRGLSLPGVGQTVTIEKPDGSIIQISLDGAEAHHGVIALGFRHLDKEAVPRLSRVSWEPVQPTAQPSKPP
jgi:hypothetical protein